RPKVPIESLEPARVLLAAPQAVEAPRPGRVAGVQADAARVADGNEFVVANRVAQRPGGEREEEAEQRGRGQASSGAARDRAIQPRRREQRGERQGGGTSQRGEPEHRARSEGYRKRGAVGGAQQQKTGEEEEDQEEGLALDVGREQDEARMERGDRAGRDRGAPSPEDRRGQQRQEQRRQRTEDGVGDLRGGHAVVAPSGDGGEEERVRRRP